MALLSFILGAVPGPADAEIIADLELPDGFASGASNVQGWAYTTTPGATLQQPFAVLIDGVEQFKVPCCGSRGDVQAVHPEAPVLTGFSAVYNWGLAAPPVLVPLSTPQGVLSPTQIHVQVVITDDMGGLKIVGKFVDLYHPTVWPFSKLAQWTESAMVAGQSADSPETALPAGTEIVLPASSHCELYNTGFYTADAAELLCTDLVFTAPDDTTDTCPAVTFSWDRGTQSFRLTSGCIDLLK